MKNPRKPQRNDGIHCTPRAGICPSEKHIPIENLVVFGRPCRPDRCKNHLCTPWYCAHLGIVCKTAYAHRDIVHTIVHTVLLMYNKFKANLVKQTLVVS